MKEGKKRSIRRFVYFVLTYFISSFLYAIIFNDVNLTDVLILSFIMAWVKDADDIQQ